MGKTSLNDLVYSFEPLKIVTPDPDYKVNEAELQKSIQKSKEIVFPLRWTYFPLGLCVCSIWHMLRVE